MRGRLQKGEGRGQLIFGLLVLFLATYIGFKVIPVMIRVYAYEDRVREECKFLHGRDLERLEKDLIGVARVEDLEVKEENIDLEKIRTENYWVLRVKINYTVPIVTPVRVWNWDRKINYEAPIFE